MKKLMLISLAGVATAIAIVAKGGNTRSVQAVVPAAGEVRVGFEPAQSVALFVGARTFSEDGTLEMVPYAVDDAVDLAYTFALDPRVALVRPEHVALALSDPAPRKQISQRRLAELKRRGAIVAQANQSQIFKLLSRQASAVGAKGIFIVSFASHGFSNDGSQYLLAANSLFREFNTAIPAARIFDLVAKSNAGRSLILIDTCRERVQRRRTPDPAPEPLSAAPLIQRMGTTAGQVVLYAAAAGKWAYDDDARQNGVFTRAVLDGLQCRAGHDRSGMVTVDTLFSTVEQSVLTWIRINRDPSALYATQANIDSAARTMPLAICSRPSPPDPPPAPAAITPPPPPPSSRTTLRQLLTDCRQDGQILMTRYDSDQPDQFVTTYVRWRDGCVAVLRDLDDRLRPTKPEDRETTRFLADANLWCTTTCPDTLSAGNCALFRETPRAERCFWDLDKAVKQIDDVLIRHPTVLRDFGQGKTQ